MKRYLVFIGNFYYPSGGMRDFKGDFNTLPECKEAIEKEFLDDYDSDLHTESPFEYIESRDFQKWSHIYDNVEGVIIWDSVRHSLYRNDLINK
jgi:hypothetical protein